MIVVCVSFVCDLIWDSGWYLAEIHLEMKREASDIMLYENRKPNSSGNAIIQEHHRESLATKREKKRCSKLRYQMVYVICFVNCHSSSLKWNFCAPYTKHTIINPSFFRLLFLSHFQDVLLSVSCSIFHSTIATKYFLLIYRYFRILFFLIFDAMELLP